MKKQFIVIAAMTAALLLLPLQAFAQEDEDANDVEQEVEVVTAEGASSVEFGVTNTESRIFHVELGFMSGYRLEDEETIVGRTMALVFSLTENMQLGLFNATFADSSLTDTYNLVRFDYFFSERLALSLGTGQASVEGPAAGNFESTVGGLIGVNALLVRSVPESGMSSTLKAGVHYLMNEEHGFGDGTVGVQIVGTIGL